MPIFKSKYQLAEPGIDPISNPIPHTAGGMKLSLTMIAGVAFGICMLFGLVVKPMLAAQAAPKLTATPTITSTITEPPTATITPTLLSILTPTRQPSQWSPVSLSPTVLFTQPPRIVQVTVLVPVVQTKEVKQTVIIIWVQTVIVTATNTYTPTVVVIEPSDTPTPSLTPTPSETLTISPTATEEPSETETPTETETPGAQE